MLSFISASDVRSLNAHYYQCTEIVNGSGVGVDDNVTIDNAQGSGPYYNVTLLCPNASGNDITKIRIGDTLAVADSGNWYRYDITGYIGESIISSGDFQIKYITDVNGDGAILPSNICYVDGYAGACADTRLVIYRDNKAGISLIKF